MVAFGRALGSNRQNDRRQPGRGVAEDVGLLLVMLIEPFDRLKDVADWLQMELICMKAGIMQIRTGQAKVDAIPIGWFSL